MVKHVTSDMYRNVCMHDLIDQWAHASSDNCYSVRLERRIASFAFATNIAFTGTCL